MITLTFDDGWQCIYDNALPILEKSEIKSTHFIVSSYLDSEQFPHYMNVEHIKDLEQKGHEIGCHSVSHKHLPQEPDYLVKSEIFNSQKYLKEQGFTVETFAYPYGEYNSDVVEMVKQAGFKGARSVMEGYNTKDTDRFLLTCQAVKVDTSAEQVKEWIDYSEQTGEWLILMFHQIDHEGRAWSTTPEILGEIVEYIKEQNVSVITMRKGIQKYQNIP